MNNEFTMSLTGGGHSQKLGVTTTVKDQVENIEITLDHFKKTIQDQKKLQGELQLQIKKLEDKTHVDFDQLYKEIAGRATYLTDTFRFDSDKQGKEFQYLELQNTILTEEHLKLNELSSGVMGRTLTIQNNVGI